MGKKLVFVLCLLLLGCPQRDGVITKVERKTDLLTGQSSWTITAIDSHNVTWTAKDIPAVSEFPKAGDTITFTCQDGGIMSSIKLKRVESEMPVEVEKR